MRKALKGGSQENIRDEAQRHKLLTSTLKEVRDIGGEEFKEYVICVTEVPG